VTHWIFRGLRHHPNLAEFLFADTTLTALARAAWASDFTDVPGKSGDREFGKKVTKRKFSYCFIPGPRT
jgi:hypothetical protein